MVAVKAKFDGQQIELPPELRGTPPGEVVIIFDESRPATAPATHPVDDRPSIWDVFGAAEKQRDAADIDAQIKEERDSWTERDERI